MTTLSVRVQPGARQNCLIATPEGWKIQVAAPPVDGAANEALCAFLAREVLRLPTRAVTVRSGAGGRRKLLSIDATAGEVEAALQSWAAAHP